MALEVCLQDLFTRDNIARNGCHLCLQHIIWLTWLVLWQVLSRLNVIKCMMPLPTGYDRYEAWINVHDLQSEGGTVACCCCRADGGASWMRSFLGIGERAVGAQTGAVSCPSGTRPIGVGARSSCAALSDVKVKSSCASFQGLGWDTEHWNTLWGYVRLYSGTWQVDILFRNYWTLESYTKQPS